MKNRFKDLDVGQHFAYNDKLYMRVNESIVFDYPNCIFFDEIEEIWLIDFLTGEALAESVDSDLTITNQLRGKTWTISKLN